MTFTIHASKDGYLMQTLRLRPHAAVSKARGLKNAGWEVHITNQHGDSYRPKTFDERACNKERIRVAFIDCQFRADFYLWSKSEWQMRR